MCGWRVRMKGRVRYGCKVVEKWEMVWVRAWGWARCNEAIGKCGCRGMV